MENEQAFSLKLHYTIVNPDAWGNFWECWASWIEQKDRKYTQPKDGLRVVRSQANFADELQAGLLYVQKRQALLWLSLRIIKLTT